jgi:hypothetical protein
MLHVAEAAKAFLNERDSIMHEDVYGFSNLAQKGIF